MSTTNTNTKSYLPILALAASALAGGCTLQLVQPDPHQDATSAAAEGDGVPVAPDEDDGESTGGSGGAMPEAGGGGTGGAGEQGGTGGAGQSELVLPERVTIELWDAVVAPWDLNKQHWDNSAPVSPELINGVTAALIGSQPYAAVASFLFSLAWEQLKPPDPYGVANIFVDGQWQQDLAVPLDDGGYSFDDTFVPQLGGVGWAHVALEPNLRIAVTLVDYDELFGGDDDPMGTVLINYDDLVAAWKSKQIHGVPVHDQGQGTILFVGLSVTAEP